MLAFDTTVVKVADDLSSTWRGTRRNSAQAALKVHAWIRAFTGELVKYRVTPDAYGDSRGFGIDHQLADALVLLDRGYSSPSLWNRVSGVGGYVLTRLPKDRNPVITALLRKHRGRARKVVGHRLQDVLVNLQRRFLDVEVSFRCRFRRYNSPKNRWSDQTFRVVVVRNPHMGTHDVYVTTAPPSLLPAEAIAQTYKLRWEVETFFKTTKSGSGLLELPPTKKHVVEALL